MPVNTNYRYGDEELLYLWDNADAVAVIFHGTFTERIAALRDKLPKIKGWLWVDDGSGDVPRVGRPLRGGRRPRAQGRCTPPWGRSGDDLYMLYTGGTTGMPKGVMWRQDDIFATLNGTGPTARVPRDGTVDDVQTAADGAGRHRASRPARSCTAPALHELHRAEHAAAAWSP